MTKELLEPQGFGEMLRMLRQRARVSRDVLAGAVGVSRTTIQNYEAGLSVPGSGVARRVLAHLSENLGEDSNTLWLELGRTLKVPSKASFKVLGDAMLGVTVPVTPVTTTHSLLVLLAIRLGADPEDLWRGWGEVVEELSSATSEKPIC